MTKLKEVKKKRLLPIEIDRYYEISYYCVPYRRPSVSRYPFPDLGVGDSFFVPKSMAKPENVKNAAYAFARRRRMKLACKTEKDGVRVKRIA